jgi:hypothetical protein
LLALLLKTRVPDRYADRHRVEHGGRVEHHYDPELVELSPELRDRVRRILDRGCHVSEFITLSELDPAVQEQIVEALADWADDSDDPMPLARALADGDLLGGREPPSVPPTVRNRIGEALTAAIGNDEPDRG